MDPKIAERFARIVRLAQRHFDEVEYFIDSTPDRKILRLSASFGPLRIFVVDLFSDARRKYRYYALDGTSVLVGFDNSPDTRAIRLKYGRITAETARMPVPHIHLNNKTDLQLTEEIEFETFIDWLKANTPHAP